ILAATGTQRNALLLEQGKTIALWYLIRLCNVDMLYEHARERYDRAIAWLDKLATGQVTLNLPLLQPGGGIGDEDSGSLPFRMGGRKKWHHE
ncbi:MAG TPA: DUF1320 family protein, partial [Phnomibacter sp.]|nr:DUF1320 family protein [Phnomibacter sp.]